MRDPDPKNCKKPYLDSDSDLNKVFGFVAALIFGRKSSRQSCLNTIKPHEHKIFAILLVVAVNCLRARFERF